MVAEHEIIIFIISGMIQDVNFVLFVMMQRLWIETSSVDRKVL